MTKVAVACTDLVRHFEGVLAVDGVSFEVPDGTVLALLGPSGCGKTTTLRLLAGLERPDEGSVEIDGRLVAAKGAFVPPEERGVGLVFQSYALFPHLSVIENVAFGLGRARDRLTLARAALERVSLDHRSDARVHELSGGEQQRVALARALAPSPRALLLDEPFANLDPSLREEVREQVADLLRQVSTTTVLVTHDQSEALSLADIVGVMNEGRLLQLASAADIYRQPRTLAVARLVGEGSELLGELNSDGRVKTALGEHALAEPITGESSRERVVFVRPERVSLSSGDEGAPCVVVGRRFHGHGWSVEVALEGGARLRLRPREAPPLGEHVRVVVEDPVLAFPAE